MTEEGARNDRKEELAMTEKGRYEIAEPLPNVVRNPAPRNDIKIEASQ